MICAEIPDPVTNPRLHKGVCKHHLHGPCGHANPNCPCMEMVNGVMTCLKDFPKDYSGMTIIDENTFPRYRRRAPEDGGQQHVVYVKREPVTLDNSHVVPYCPFLLLRYDAHLNVENVFNLQTVKYLFK